MATGNFPAAFDDGILTKSDHEVILMMEKNEKTIIHSPEDKVLNIDQKDIEQYLSEVKEAVERIITGLTGTLGGRITSICFWIMLLTKRKQKKSY